MSKQAITTYPLTWPEGWPRTDRRKVGPFRTRWDVTENELRNELRLLGATDVVISSNLVRTKTGEIAARQSTILDPGVAVYFKLRGAQRCIHCDRWFHVVDNLRAIFKTIEAIRGIDRWGSPGLVEAAFQGIAELGAGSATDHLDWASELGVDPWASLLDIELAYKRRAKKLHPDTGGDAVRFSRLTEAYELAKQRAS